MRNFLEKFLISFLLVISILLGLSFWLNIKYGFNIFLSSHWEILSQLQAKHTPVSLGFYISFGVAFFILIIGLIAIFRVRATPMKINQPTTIKIEERQTIIEPSEIPQPQYMPSVRPPRLNIPRNMAQVAMATHNQQSTTNNSQSFTKQPMRQTNQPSPYNSVLADIFKNAGYTVKTNPMISGFTTNLFAIGNNEKLWIGGVDCDINALKTAVKKLHDTFQDTLEDIIITINPFILDNSNRYTDDDSVLIFHNIDEIKEFISAHPADTISENEQENFDAYSEYIDTIIQYVKNI